MPCGFEVYAKPVVCRIKVDGDAKTTCLMCRLDRQCCVHSTFTLATPLRPVYWAVDNASFVLLLAQICPL